MSQFISAEFLKSHNACTIEISNIEEKVKSISLCSLYLILECVLDEMQIGEPNMTSSAIMEKLTYLLRVIMA